MHLNVSSHKAFLHDYLSKHGVLLIVAGKLYKPCSLPPSGICHVSDQKHLRTNADVQISSDIGMSGLRFKTRKLSCMPPDHYS